MSASPEPLPAMARRIAAALPRARQVLMVGGCVRDRLLGLPVKDIDLEVYGLSYAEITDALRAAGFRLDLVGRQFAVLKIDNLIDVAVPRRERKSGPGHRGFAAEPDPAMTPAEAALRRDYTINAMAEDFAGNLYDPHGGQRDLAAGVLRAVSPAFAEDPLRVLRGMQLAARFNLRMEPGTLAMCRDLAGEYSSLARERIWLEWEKWAALGVHPAQGLRVLQETGWLAFFPELAALVGVPQDPGWHPEGDVFVHTLHVCDAAAAVARREQPDREEHVVLLLAALCHDFGKATLTVQNEAGRWVSPGHDQAGVPLAENFLHRLQAPARVIERVLPLVAQHMAHMSGDGRPPSERAVRRLANRLHPATLRQLARVVEADASGRPPLPPCRPLAPWLEMADRMALADRRPQRILLGRHLLARGAAPGPAMGRILDQAFEAQLDGAFADLAGALRWLDAQGGGRSDRTDRTD
jgi:tRNA nucleotidyltransferase (CCA-adding enzyme)